MSIKVKNTLFCFACILFISPAFAQRTAPTLSQPQTNLAQDFQELARHPLAGLTLIYDTNNRSNNLVRKMDGKWDVKSDKICIDMSELRGEFSVKNLVSISDSLRKRYFTGLQFYQAARFTPPNPVQEKSAEEFYYSLGYALHLSLSQSMGKKIMIYFTPAMTTCNRDISIIPAYHLDETSQPKGNYVKISPWLEKVKSGQAEIYGQLTIAELQKAEDAKIKADKAKEQKADDKEKSLSQSLASGLEATYGALKVGPLGFQTCILKESEALLHLATRQLIASKEIRGQMRSNPAPLREHKTEDDIFADLQATTAKACTLYIASGPSLIRMKQALNRANIGSELIEPMLTGKEALANAGFNSLEELKFATEVNVLQKEEFAKLRPLGLDNRQGYNGAMTRYSAALNNQKPSSVGDLMGFVQDEAEAKKQGKSINAYYSEQMKKREEEQKARNQANLEAEKKRSIEFPYIAYISCTIQQQFTPIQACMSDKSIKTEIELKNGSDYKMAQIFDVQTLGHWNGRELEIDLRKNFFLKAQNASENLLLNLVVKNRLDGKIVFQKSVSRFGVVSVKN